MKLDILLPCYKPRKNWDDSIVNAIGKLKTKIGSDAEITLHSALCYCHIAFDLSLCERKDGFKLYLVCEV